MMTAKLVRSSESGACPEDAHVKENALIGTIVSSLYSLKDTDNQQGGFFVFGDLSVKIEGWFKLEFSLYEIRERECYTLSSVVSKQFQVFQQKYFPGMAESTFLTRSFSDQGVRLRLRKDSRSITTRKRNADVAKYTRESEMRATMAQTVASPALSRRSPHTHRPVMQHEIESTRAQDIMVSQPAYYSDATAQVMSNSLGHDPASVAVPYGFQMDDRPSKRQRYGSVHSVHSVHDRSVGYDSNQFATYATSGPGPRTLPDLGNTMMSPMSNGAYTPTQHTMQALHPLNYPVPPRLDTQLTTHSAGPNSASSNFSPGTRRSPQGAYQFSAGPSQPLYPVTSATPMSFHTGATLPGMGHANGLGMMGSHVSLGPIDGKMVAPVSEAGL